MIDVSKLHGSSCPRCVDRRVYQIDENQNLWLCIANAMPVPWRRDQLITHDAEQFLEEEAFDRERNQEETQDQQVNYRR